MRKIFILAPIVLAVAFAASYFAGLWTPAPTAARIASLRDAYLRIAPTDKADLRFAVFGDVRDGRVIAEKIIAEVEKDGGYSFAVCDGDMASEPTENAYDAFVKAALSNWRKTPLVFVPGNHDVWKKGGDRNALYNKYFGATHYSFAVGKTLFVTIDNATKDVFQQEYQWTENLLKTERAKHDNLVVFMHFPPFDLRSGVEWHAMDKEQGEKLFALLKEYKATAIFCSHIHAYEEWNKDGIPVYVSGGGGADLAEDRPDAYFHYLEVVMHDGKFIVTVHRIK